MTIITLLTDFGHKDSFVGAMKGVVLQGCPQAQLIDLCHAIPAQDIAAGAWQLRRAWHCFPAGTVHLVVVDPGVGSDRRVLIAHAAGHRFVVPDNGLLDFAVGDQVDEVVAVECDQVACLRRPISTTFHGRDVFAPLAAALAAGSLEPVAAGTVIDDWQRLPWPPVIESDDGWHGAVISADHFGNLITNLPADLELAALVIGGVRFPVADCYAAAEPGAPLALVGSDGYWEACCNHGSAADSSRTSVGASVDGLAV